MRNYDSADPDHPVPIVFFGFGHADLVSMRAITSVTGGAVLPVAQPADMIGALLTAMGQVLIGAN